ncbi:MAG: 4'-phosphopantetheinyl transferase superfamily protein, partial [Bacteriovorax sp.]|nr:4'-phosphopantetheinyl transferase superfamily protein [Bacteriovorax sp.]
ELKIGSVLLSLPISESRAPLWPVDIVGSITHNHSLVGAAVSKNTELLGVGIDFEVMDRVKCEMGRYICGPQDLKSHADLSDTEILTLIFSAKESLYKALYPSVNCFFGFNAAAVKEINFLEGSFIIELVSQINLNFGPSGRSQFQGRFLIQDNNCLTVLEIKP